MGASSSKQTSEELVACSSFRSRTTAFETKGAPWVQPTGSMHGNNAARAGRLQQADFAGLTLATHFHPIAPGKHVHATSTTTPTPRPHSSSQRNIMERQPVQWPSDPTTRSPVNENHLKSLKTLQISFSPETSGSQREKRSRLHHVLNTKVLPSLSPQGVGSNDSSEVERALNVVTSLPFIAVGLHTHRKRSTRAGKRFGATFVGVGCVATAYHGAKGQLRAALRKLDYWSIALSTACLRHVVQNQRGSANRLPRAVDLAVTIALTPFKPTWVTGLNLAAVEASYIKAARACPSLRPTWRRHAAMSAVALTCFGLEDVAAEAGLPVLHSAWHCLAAGGIASANGLLKHQEQCHVKEHAWLPVSGALASSC